MITNQQPTATHQHPIKIHSHDQTRPPEQLHKIQNNDQEQEQTTKQTIAS
jgi:hypothetical protein